MGLVAYISYLKTRNEVGTKDGYFLAGRSLTGTFIAGSLLLTNLSAEQLIALNGSAYGFNLTSMAWEVTAGVAIILMALVFLPRYLNGAFTTLPEFLNSRFDDGVRRLSVILFMLGYGLITGPAVLYSGALAVLQLFDVPSLFNITFGQALVFTVVTIGVIGSLYAIFGGLKAVAVSDTINGIGLLIVGLLVPILGLILLGEGDPIQGLSTITSTKTEKLNAVGGPEDPIPFGTIFTGIIFANLFYWCTNQYVIQRTLGAKSLAEGQKGVLISGYFKLMVPFMMMLPGTIAFHLYGDTLGSIDLAYPKLVSDVLPKFMTGFFLAVLLGAVFSSFNSLLNSAATMFVLDVYAPLKKSELSNSKLIHIAKIASVILAILSFIIAPLLQFAPKGLWELIRVFTGFYNIPIIAIVVIGLFTRKVPAIAAKVTIFFHVIAYGLYRFYFEWDIHYVHMYAVLFGIEVILMLIIGKMRPVPAKSETTKANITLSPWPYAIPVSATLVWLIISLYLLFSPIGLVGGLEMQFWVIFMIISAANLTFCILYISRNQSNKLS